MSTNSTKKILKLFKDFTPVGENHVSVVLMESIDWTVLTAKYRKEQL